LIFEIRFHHDVPPYAYQELGPLAEPDGHSAFFFCLEDPVQIFLHSHNQQTSSSCPLSLYFPPVLQTAHVLSCLLPRSGSLYRRIGRPVNRSQIKPSAGVFKTGLMWIGEMPRPAAEISQQLGRPGGHVLAGRAARTRSRDLSPAKGVPPGLSRFHHNYRSRGSAPMRATRANLGFSRRPRIPSDLVKKRPGACLKVFSRVSPAVWLEKGAGMQCARGCRPLWFTRPSPCNARNAPSPSQPLREPGPRFPSCRPFSLQSLGNPNPTSSGSAFLRGNLLPRSGHGKTQTGPPGGFHSIAPRPMLPVESLPGARLFAPPRMC